MVPSAIVLLDDVPLNGNGKLDRSRLPAPAPQDFGSTERRAPASAMEREITALVLSVLGVDGIDIGDNLFDLGGDSLVAGRLALRIEDRFGISMPTSEVMRAPTLSDLLIQVVIRRVESAPDDDGVQQIIATLDEEEIRRVDMHFS